MCLLLFIFKFLLKNKKQLFSIIIYPGWFSETNKTKGKKKWENEVREEKRTAGHAIGVIAFD